MFCAGLVFHSSVIYACREVRIKCLAFAKAWLTAKSTDLWRARCRLFCLEVLGWSVECLGYKMETIACLHLPRLPAPWLATDFCQHFLMIKWVFDPMNHGEFHRECHSNFHEMLSSFTRKLNFQSNFSWVSAVLIRQLWGLDLLAGVKNLPLKVLTRMSFSFTFVYISCRAFPSCPDH